MSHMIWVQKRGSDFSYGQKWAEMGLFSRRIRKRDYKRGALSDKNQWPPYNMKPLQVQVQWGTKLGPPKLVGFPTRH